MVTTRSLPCSESISLRLTEAPPPITATYCAFQSGYHAGRSPFMPAERLIAAGRRSAPVRPPASCHTLVDFVPPQQAVSAGMPDALRQRLITHFLAPLEQF